MATADPIYNPPLTGGGGVSGVTPTAILFGASDGSATYSSDFTWDDTNKIFDVDIGTGGGIRFGNSSAPGDARARFFFRIPAADNWMEISNPAATADLQLIIRNSSGRTLSMGVQGGSSASGASFGLTAAGLHMIRAASSASGLAIGCFDNGSVFLGTSNLVRLKITGLGSVVMGATAALATTATSGFFYTQSCAGDPTGVPVAETGRCATVYDTVDDEFYVYNGAWVKIALA